MTIIGQMLKSLSRDRNAVVLLSPRSDQMQESLWKKGLDIPTFFNASDRVGAAKRQILAIRSARVGEVALSAVREVPRTH